MGKLPLTPRSRIHIRQAWIRTEISSKDVRPHFEGAGFVGEFSLTPRSRIYIRQAWTLTGIVTQRCPPHILREQVFWENFRSRPEVVFTYGKLGYEQKYHQKMPTPHFEGAGFVGEFPLTPRSRIYIRRAWARTGIVTKRCPSKLGLLAEVCLYSTIYI